MYLEAYGLLFVHDFHIPFIGRWDGLGFLQDFFAVAVLLGIGTFAIIRLRSEPKEYGRESRFYGSHTGGAWLILFMIFNVIWTYALVRGSAVNTGNLPYGNGAFFSQFMGAVLHPLGLTANEWIETVALLLHIGVMLIFLLIVLHSKHLHIGLAPLNVTFKRLPNAPRPTAARRVQGRSRSTSRIRPRTRYSAAARSRTSPGRATSTSPRVPSAAAASHSARRGTPESRCRPSSSSWTCATTCSPRRHTSSGDKETPVENTPEGGVGRGLVETKHDEEHHVPESGFAAGARGLARCRPPARSSAPPSNSASSTPTCCGPAPPVVRASSSARWTSSTSTTSSTCAATR